MINSIEVQRPLKRETALVTEGMNRGAAMAQANHLLPVMRARRLDFIVLEHDEDLIGPAVRAELTAGHHTERPATRDDAAARAARGEAVASPR